MFAILSLDSDAQLANWNRKRNSSRFVTWGNDLGAVIRNLGMSGEYEFIAWRELPEKRQVLEVVSRSLGLMVKACINYNCQATERTADWSRIVPALTFFLPSRVTTRSDFQSYIAAVNRMINLKICDTENAKSEAKNNTCKNSLFKKRYIFVVDNKTANCL